MTTRRATLRSSAFVLLALAAVRVPACEYGQDGANVLTIEMQRPAPDLPAVDAPILANLPTLLV